MRFEQLIEARSISAFGMPGHGKSTLFEALFSAITRCMLDGQFYMSFEQAAGSRELPGRLLSSAAYRYSLEQLPQYSYWELYGDIERKVSLPSPKNTFYILVIDISNAAYLSHLEKYLAAIEFTQWHTIFLNKTDQTNGRSQVDAVSQMVNDCCRSKGLESASIVVGSAAQALTTIRDKRGALDGRSVQPIFELMCNLCEFTSQPHTKVLPSEASNDCRSKHPISTSFVEADLDGIPSGFQEDDYDAAFRILNKSDRHQTAAKAFGRWLSEWRQQKRLTLAQVVGLSKGALSCQTLSRIERGECARRPHFSTLHSISVAMALSIQQVNSIWSAFERDPQLTSHSPELMSIIIGDFLQYGQTKADQRCKSIQTDERIRIDPRMARICRQALEPIMAALTLAEGQKKSVSWSKLLARTRRKALHSLDFDGDGGLEKLERQLDETMVAVMRRCET